jgi:general stress protein 26
MDSINQQQPEANREDLRGEDAVRKIRELIKSSPTCFFCTQENGTSRPMSVQKVDDDGSLWFLSARDSHKNEELGQDSNVKLYFQGSSHSNFLEMTGRGIISTDRKRIEKLWQPIMATWFTGGKDDPRITVIQVIPTDGYYWTTKHGQVIAFAKMAICALLGKTLDDSIEGRLKV